jgi:hypothetical protein
MSVNRERPHLYVLPEDDANRQLANGFVRKVTRAHQVRLLPEAGGRDEVRDIFLADYVSQLWQRPQGFMVLLRDFDNDRDVVAQLAAQIPADVRPRVFILGVLSEPEPLRNATGLKLEAIGVALAEECRRGQRELWQHPLLAHNLPEVERLAPALCPLLF